MDLIQVNQLSVGYEEGFVLSEISFTVKKGDILCIAGESGSGKSTLAKAMANIFEKGACVHGEVIYNGANILDKTQEEMRAIRQKEIAICFQSSGELLNPMLTLREQLYEILGRKYENTAFEKTARHVLSMAGLEADVLDKRKSQLSGGMLQKFLIACAIALEPAVVILDEPTSSLDYASRKTIIRLIREMNEKQGTTFITVTHDLSFAAETAGSVMVLYNGWAAEYGPAGKVIYHPGHPYTKGLMGSSPEVNLLRDIWGIRPSDTEEGPKDGCRFFGRCNQRIRGCASSNPYLECQEEDGERYIACIRGGIVKLLEGKNLSKTYGNKKVAEDLNLSLYSSETIGILGVSGIGKTTLMSMLCGFIQPDGGEVWFDGEKADFKRIRRMKNGLQMVLQDPTASINPDFTVFKAVSEPLAINYAGDHRPEVANVLKQVGLPSKDSFLDRKISHLSGGEKQRVSIARALVMKPKVLIADEIASMLDTSNKANLLRLLKGLQYENGFSLLYVTHDVHSAVKISDRVLVYRGKKELVDIRELCGQPKLELKDIYK